MTYLEKNKVWWRLLAMARIPNSVGKEVIQWWFLVMAGIPNLTGDKFLKKVKWWFLAMARTHDSAEKNTEF